MGVCKRYTLILLLKNVALTTKDGLLLEKEKINRDEFEALFTAESQEPQNVAI